MRLTEEDKEHITELRASGTHYQKIADTLGFSISTVKSYIRRHGVENSTLVGNEKKMYVYCLNCGATLHQLLKTKRKKFCCDACRSAWWNAHHDRSQRKKVKRNCLCCGKEFEADGSSPQKYCSTDCYIKNRFKDYTPKAQRHERCTATGGKKHSALPDGCLCASCAWFNNGERHCSGYETADENV